MYGPSLNGQRFGGRVGYGPSLLWAKFVMGRVCYGPRCPGILGSIFLVTNAKISWGGGKLVELSYIQFAELSKVKNMHSDFVIYLKDSKLTGCYRHYMKYMYDLQYPK